MEAIESLTMYTEMYIRRTTHEGVTEPAVDPRAQQIEDAIKKLLATGLLR